MKLAMSTRCSKWSQPAVLQGRGGHKELVPLYPRPSSLLRMTAPSSNILFRARSCELITVMKPRFSTLRKACSAGLDSAFSDDDDIDEIPATRGMKEPPAFSRTPKLMVFLAHSISGANAAALIVADNKDLRIQKYDACAVLKSFWAAAEEERRLWNSIVEEAGRMQAELRGKALDAETVCWFVSPVTAKVEQGDDYPDYSRTEVMYQVGLAQEPNNSLMLANYAQFLFLVVHDYVRADEYFSRALEAKPKDAEAFNKYANFLWRAKEDLLAAEQNFLEAISMEPDNSFYAAAYAHFLWNTGCEGVCFISSG